MCSINILTFVSTYRFEKTLIILYCIIQLIVISESFEEKKKFEKKYTIEQI